MPPMQPSTSPQKTTPGRTAFPTLGILGGGQLGRMLAVAALRLGVQVRFLSPKPAGPMQAFGDVTVADWTSPDVLRAFGESCDVVTVESEWAPGDLLAKALPGGPGVWPRPKTVHLIRHKGRQKDALREAGLPVPAFRRCASLDEALAAADDLGYPALLKQYEGSYDGYGNATVEDADELRAAWPDLAAEDGLLVEQFADFERELSVIVARRSDGEAATYPVAYTEQRDHRCHAVVVPAGVSPEVEAEARRVGKKAVEAVGGVGVTAVELFEMKDSRILVNELAPRPHNTGHYSIEGCPASQFENHVRAVLGWPLGRTELRVPCAVMVNVLGRRDGSPPQTEGLTEALAVPGASVHLYGKPDVRPTRKMGHVTATGPDPEDTRRRAEKAAAFIRL